MKNVFVRTLALVVVLLAGVATAPAVILAQQPGSQSEFVPIDQLPPQDQLPAAPLLIGAYVFVLVALFAYVFSLAKRLGRVQREVERLEADMKRSGRG